MLLGIQPGARWQRQFVLPQWFLPESAGQSSQFRGQLNRVPRFLALDQSRGLPGELDVAAESRFRRCDNVHAAAAVHAARVRRRPARPRQQHVPGPLPGLPGRHLRLPDDAVLRERPGAWTGRDLPAAAVELSIRLDAKPQYRSAFVLCARPNSPIQRIVRAAADANVLSDWRDDLLQAFLAASGHRLSARPGFVRRRLLPHWHNGAGRRLRGSGREVPVRQFSDLLQPLRDAQLHQRRPMLPGRLEARQQRKLHIGEGGDAPASAHVRGALCV